MGGQGRGDVAYNFQGGMDAPDTYTLCPSVYCRSFRLMQVRPEKRSITSSMLMSICG
jgi:hypothetical protein